MTDGERMFRLEITLGAIIELCECSITGLLQVRDTDPKEAGIEATYLAVSTAVNTICRINGLDPHALHQQYINWQNGLNYVEGENND